MSSVVVVFLVVVQLPTVFSNGLQATRTRVCFLAGTLVTDLTVLHGGVVVAETAALGASVLAAVVAVDNTTNGVLTRVLTSKAQLWRRHD